MPTKYCIFRTTFIIGLWLAIGSDELVKAAYAN
jgi:hypothetical protein